MELVKPPLWIKHAVRRWKQMYRSILALEGDFETLDILNRLTSEHVSSPVHKMREVEPEPISSIPPPSLSKKASDFQPRFVQRATTNGQKSNNGRFLVKVKEID